MNTANDSISAFFSRSAAILGSGAMERLAAARIAVFGVGGVGGWCAEALVRTGVGHLSIVDGDTVAPSNANRQVMATSATVGRPKVEVLAERLREINPSAEIRAFAQRFGSGTAEFFSGEISGCGCAIDAIDSVADKAALIRLCGSLGVPVFSSMGAALRLDPTRIRISRFAKVQGDGLARALRIRFRKDGQGPAPDFLCVHSEETPLSIPERGSLMPVTATFGMVLASLAIRAICG